MPEVLLMPALSPTMTHGHIVKWHKNPGDKVQAGDALLDIETDKAVMEVEATTQGIIHHIFMSAPCPSVAVGSVIALLRQPHEDPASIDLSVYSMMEPAQASAKIQTPQPLEEDRMPVCSREEGDAQAHGANQGPRIAQEASERQKISPLARKLAQNHQVPLSAVKATGPGGRIVEKDIVTYLDQKASLSHASSSYQTRAPGQSHVVPLTPMRQAIAQRLSLSKQTIPHFYLTMDFSMDALLSLRAQLNEKIKRFSVNDLLVRACALALRDKPVMAQQWHDNGILHHDSVDLAVAVSIEGGLITPILHRAHEKSLTEITKELRSLIERARAGKLAPQEYQGGSFTLSNLGMFGVDHFQAIINPPHCAILAVAATRLAPVVRQGKVEAGQIMSASLAVDHRVLDGQDAAEFLAILREYVEKPYLLLS